MKTDRLPSLLAAAAGIAVLLPLSPGSLAAQDKKSSFVASKGWYNQPDLQGIWMPAKPVDNLEKGNYIKDPSNH